MKKVALGVVFLLIASLLQAQTRETRNVETFTKISYRMAGKLYLKQGSAQKVELEGPADVLREVETEVKSGKLIIGKEGRWMNWNWNDRDRINIYITVKDLEALSVSGSGDLIGEGKFITGNLDLNVSGSGKLQLEFSANGNVEADVSGSGDVDIKGTCNNFDSDVAGSGNVKLAVTVQNIADLGVSGSGKIVAEGSAREIRTKVSGSGKVLAGRMSATTCNVRISGSGDVEINVKEELDVSISGSGNVTYTGDPARVNSHASGSGHVRKR
ncbi:MAG: head GIN domain-containing protein [Cytophagales bacterium]|nr:head GIN domain-containing protein [Cytophagales bacterium]